MLKPARGYTHTHTHKERERERERETVRVVELEPHRHTAALIAKLRASQRRASLQYMKMSVRNIVCVEMTEQERTCVAFVPTPKATWNT